MTIPRWAWITMATVSVIVVIGGTVWWLRARATRSLQYVQFLATSPTSSYQTTSLVSSSTQPTPYQPNDPITPPFFAPTIPRLPGLDLDPPSSNQVSEAPPTPVVDDDPDKDGLTDDQERQAGTDVQKSDTDNDELKDGDEVKKFRTDPLKPDTDGDGYTDAQEIKNGYNPLGTGKCLTSDCSF